jgi:hypothetical protein
MAGAITLDIATGVPQAMPEPDCGAAAWLMRPPFSEVADRPGSGQSRSAFIAPQHEAAEAFAFAQIRKSSAH